MAPLDWTLLHPGALGDLVLALHLAARIPEIRRAARLNVYSRIALPPIRISGLHIRFASTESLHLDWLFRDPAAAGPAPTKLQSAIAQRGVLNLYSGPTHPLHERLRAMNPLACFSLDTATPIISDAKQHILKTWERRLNEQGLLARSCTQLERCGHRFHLDQPDTADHHRRDEHPKPDILIHPGSGGIAKCWPLANFLNLAASFAADGRTVAFILGPAEAERWPAEKIAEIRRNHDLIQPADIHELASQLAAAPLYIGNDSGPTHLAAALGTPTLALFGPTRAARWRPLGRAVETLQGDPARDDAWGIPPAAIRTAALRLCSPS
ncbi:MAG: glycosyltransferase family 9 protein [Phycisphaerae bacterium]|nr:glycosyltransferase family 9 protein [Phycisphaerae bacterium]